MRVIRGLSHIRPADRGVAISLGNYDGVHLGHQALFAELGRIAPGRRPCAVCFEPQPLEFLRPELAPVRLQSLAEKLRCLRAIGVDQALVLRFDRQLCEMPATDFVREVLIQGLAVCDVIVGDDYRFGFERRGDTALLREMAPQGGYRVHALPTVSRQGLRVSSTGIREALAAGRIIDANARLGRPYRLRGRVVHGLKLGRKLGAPTANVALRRASPLRHGVYCVRLQGLPAVANIGMRPTVGGQDELLEVHLLERVEDLYGQIVDVDFERFLRPEEKFDDLDALQAAIGRDVAQARDHFRQDDK